MNNINNINEDIKLKLLAGLSLNVQLNTNKINIKPLSLREIAEIGYEQYTYYLMMLVKDPKDYSSVDDSVDLETITTWDILISGMYYADKEYQSFIIDAFSLFLNADVGFSKNTNEFFLKDKNEKIIFINKEVFEEIKHCLKLQNCIDKNKEEMKTANSKAEEIKQKILKGRQMLNKKQNNIVTFEDLVSTLAANGNGLNIINIWDLKMYQFNNQFARMQMIEDYDLNIRSLLAGAKKEDVKLKHYIRPIEN